EVDSRNTPIKGICGDASNLRGGGNVGHRGIQIGRRHMVVVVDEAQIVRRASLAVDPARICIQALRARPAGKRWKRANNVARGLRPAQTHIEVVLRPTPSATPSAATAATRR